MYIYICGDRYMSYKNVSFNKKHCQETMAWKSAMLDLTSSQVKLQWNKGHH